MIFSLSSLEFASKYRLPGYLDAVFSMAIPLGNNQFELTTKQVAYLAKYRIPIDTPPTGLGDAVKSVIHAGLDLLPISDSTKTRIKSCSKCAQRAATLNKMIPNVNPFTNSPSDKSDSSK